MGKNLSYVISMGYQNLKHGKVLFEPGRLCADLTIQTNRLGLLTPEIKNSERALGKNPEKV